MVMPGWSVNPSHTIIGQAQRLVTDALPAALRGPAPQPTCDSKQE